MKRLVLGATILILMVVPMSAQDPAKVGPNVYKCIFENDQLRLCEIRFRPGDRIGAHSHPNHAAYVTSPGKLRITASNGQTTDAEFKAGDAIWIPAETHSAVNVGNTELRGLVIELKESDPVKNALLAMEHEWGPAMVKRDFAALDRIMAPDWVLTAPDGTVQTRDQALADLRSGALKFESMVPSQVEVRLFGDTAIVTGFTDDRGTYKGEDVSGRYRFTDVFVNRNGKWQAVSTHVTPVMTPK